MNTKIGGENGPNVKKVRNESWHNNVNLQLISVLIETLKRLKAFSFLDILIRKLIKTWCQFYNWLIRSVLDWSLKKISKYLGVKRICLK